MNLNKLQNPALRKLNLTWVFIVIFIFTDARADLKSRPAEKKIKQEGKQVSLEKREIKGAFNFFASTYSPDIPTGSYSLKGSFDPKNNDLKLEGVEWIKRPPNYEMVSLQGRVNAEGTSFTGKINFDDCREFVLKRTTRNALSPISGKWEGSYICAQGVTGLTLILE